MGNSSSCIDMDSKLNHCFGTWGGVTQSELEDVSLTSERLKEQSFEQRKYTPEGS